MCRQSHSPKRRCKALPQPTPARVAATPQLPPRTPTQRAASAGRASRTLLLQMLPATARFRRRCWTRSGRPKRARLSRAKRPWAGRSATPAPRALNPWLRARGSRRKSPPSRQTGSSRSRGMVLAAQAWAGRRRSGGRIVGLATAGCAPLLFSAATIRTLRGCTQGWSARSACATHTLPPLPRARSACFVESCAAWHGVARCASSPSSRFTRCLRRRPTPASRARRRASS